MSSSGELEGIGDVEALLLGVEFSVSPSGSNILLFNDHLIITFYWKQKIYRT
jgi:hypothetical protein